VRSLYEVSLQPSHEVSRGKKRVTSLLKKTNHAKKKSALTGNRSSQGGSDIPGTKEHHSGRKRPSSLKAERFLSGKGEGGEER